MLLCPEICRFCAIFGRFGGMTSCPLWIRLCRKPRRNKIFGKGSFSGHDPDPHPSIENSWRCPCLCLLKTSKQLTKAGLPKGMKGKTSYFVPMYVGTYIVSLFAPVYGINYLLFVPFLVLLVLFVLYFISLMTALLPSLQLWSSLPCSLASSVLMLSSLKLSERWYVLSTGHTVKTFLEVARNAAHYSRRYSCWFRMHW